MINGLSQKAHLSSNKLHIYQSLPDVHFSVGQFVATGISNNEVIDTCTDVLHINWDQGIRTCDLESSFKHPAALFIEDGNDPLRAAVPAVEIRNSEPAIIG